VAGHRWQGSTFNYPEIVSHFLVFLERSLERRSVEAERYQQIVAGLTQTNHQLSARVLELEAPTEPTGLAEDASEPAQVPAEDATRSVTPRTVQTNLAAPRSRGGVECSVAELLLIGLLRSSRCHSPTPFYLSFTKGLRPFNSEAQRRV
jgi:hypothetical protein